MKRMADPKSSAISVEMPGPMELAFPMSSPMPTGLLGTLELYPAVEGLDDQALCQATLRALFDSQEDELCQGECVYCGETFEYVKEGKHRRTRCPSCVKLRKHRLEPNALKGLHGKDNAYVRFLGINLNYRPGNWYRVAVVEADIQMGLAEMNDFDFAHVVRSDRPFEAMKTGKGMKR